MCLLTMHKLSLACNYLYILNTSTCVCVCVTNTFSKFWGLFTFLLMSFREQKFLWSPIYPFFSFCGLCFLYSKTSFLTSKSQRFSPMLSTECFILFAFMLRSMIHFKLIFMYNEESRFVIFLYEYVADPAWFIGKTILFSHGLT